MKPTEAAALLTIAAAYDNRKPDADQAKAWAMILADLRFEDCRAVILEHYTKSREWLMPADVISGVKRLRAERLRRFGHIPPPAHLADDPAAEVEWFRRVKSLVADGQITSLDQVDDQRGELKARDLRSLGEIGGDASA